MRSKEVEKLTHRYLLSLLNDLDYQQYEEKIAEHEDAVIKFLLSKLRKKQHIALLYMPVIPLLSDKVIISIIRLMLRKELLSGDYNHECVSNGIYALSKKGYKAARVLIRLMLITKTRAGNSRYYFWIEPLLAGLGADILDKIEDNITRESDIRETSIHALLFMIHTGKLSNHEISRRIIDKYIGIKQDQNSDLGMGIYQLPDEYADILDAHNIPRYKGT